MPKYFCRKNHIEIIAPGAAYSECPRCQSPLMKGSTNFFSCYPEILTMQRVGRGGVVRAQTFNNGYSQSFSSSNDDLWRELVEGQEFHRVPDPREQAAETIQRLRRGVVGKKSFLNSLPIKFCHDIKDFPANLSVFPSFQLRPLSTNMAAVVLGDLHGNACKLIYFLAALGIIQVDAALYAEIYGQYMSFSYDRRSLHHLEGCVSAIVLHPKWDINIEIILIGDTLCDRGQSDYFTLLVMKRMAEMGLKFSIIFSNHDFEALKISKDGWNTNASNYVNPSSEYTQFGNSWDHHKLDLDFAQKFEDIFTQVYMTKLHLFSYYGDIVFSHAPLVKNSLLLSRFGLKKNPDGSCRAALNIDYSLFSHANDAYTSKPGKLSEVLEQCNKFLRGGGTRSGFLVEKDPQKFSEKVFILCLFPAGLSINSHDIPGDMDREKSCRVNIYGHAGESLDHKNNLDTNFGRPGIDTGAMRVCFIYRM